MLRVRFITASAGLLMLPVLAQAADDLIFATSSQFQVVSSDKPSTVVDHLGYTLDSGDSLIAIDVNSQDQFVYALTRNTASQTCRVHRFQPADNDAATVALNTSNRVGADFSCAAVVDSETNKASGIGFAVAGKVLYDGTDKSGVVQARTVHNSSGTGTPNLVGIACDNTDADCTPLYAVDAASNSLVSLAPDDLLGGVAETVIGSLGVNLQGKAAPLDFKDGVLYLMTGGKVYTVNVSSGATSLLGSAPSGVLPVMAIDLSGDGGTGSTTGGSTTGGNTTGGSTTGGSTTGGSTTAGNTTGGGTTVGGATDPSNGNGGGALGLSLLPMLALAGLLKRRRG